MNSLDKVDTLRTYGLIVSEDNFLQVYAEEVRCSSKLYDADKNMKPPSWSHPFCFPSQRVRDLLLKILSLFRAEEADSKLEFSSNQIEFLLISLTDMEHNPVNCQCNNVDGSDEPTVIHKSSPELQRKPETVRNHPHPPPDKERRLQIFKPFIEW